MAAPSGQQRRWPRDGGAIRLGTRPLGERLRLFALGACTPTGHRGPWVHPTSRHAARPQRPPATFGRRRRAEQAIEVLHNGHDLDHLVSYRLHPNQVAIGFRLLARNLASGAQLVWAQARPIVIREPRTVRTTLPRWRRGPTRYHSPPPSVERDTRGRVIPLLFRRHTWRMHGLARIPGSRVPDTMAAGNRPRRHDVSRPG
ncbi:MAG TPA: hypothetical protein VIL85_02455 [Thermomicrobiales bacterium]